MSQPTADPTSQPADLQHEANLGETGAGTNALESVNEREVLEARARQGANWFYWVAGLSIVNSAISLFEGDRHFVVGMGVTQIVDGIAAMIAPQNAELSTIIRGVAFGISVAIAGVAAGFGWLARKGFVAAFIIGMGLYLLDGLLFLLFQDWLSLGFHAFALFGMWNGLTATRSLKAFDEQMAFGSPVAHAESVA